VPPFASRIAPAVFPRRLAAIPRWTPLIQRHRSCMMTWMRAGKAWATCWIERVWFDSHLGLTVSQPQLIEQSGLMVVSRTGIEPPTRPLRSQNRITRESSAGVDLSEDRRKRRARCSAICEMPSKLTPRYISLSALNGAGSNDPETNRIINLVFNGPSFVTTMATGLTEQRRRHVRGVDW
jgi:hypothetical protein